MFFRLSTDLYGPIHRRSVRYRVVTMNKVKYNGGLTRKSGSNTVFDGTLENFLNKTFMRVDNGKSCCVCCIIFFVKPLKYFTLFCQVQILRNFYSLCSLASLNVLYIYRWRKLPLDCFTVVLRTGKFSTFGL